MSGKESLTNILPGYTDKEEIVNYCVQDENHDGNRKIKRDCGKIKKRGRLSVGQGADACKPEARETGTRLAGRISEESIRGVRRADCRCEETEVGRYGIIHGKEFTKQYGQNRRTKICGKEGKV